MGPMYQGLRLSAMTPMSEVRSYFSGKPFEGRWDGDSYEGTVSAVSLRIKATGKSYDVHVESVDDPDDSEDVTTGEPLRAIAEFLGRDIPGGEHFERMSSSPAFVARSVALAAELVASGSISRRAAVRMLRRISSWVPVADSSPSREADLSDLEKDARRKGWKSRLKKDAHGDDVLEIDVSGIYRASVTLDAIVYEYELKVRGDDGVSDSGTTDDPIREFERWAQSDPVREAFARARREEKPGPDRTRSAPADDQRTRRAPAEEALS